LTSTLTFHSWPFGKFGTRRGDRLGSEVHNLQHRISARILG
jgi:hypothetical protein